MEGGGGDSMVRYAWMIDGAAVMALHFAYSTRSS